MKYYGTLGPACEKKEILIQMIQNGMSGVRLNLSHSNLRECEKWIEQLRLAEHDTGKKQERIIDLNGPELRVEGRQTPLQLTQGEVISFARIAIPENCKRYLTQGQIILLDDGKIQVEVLEDKESGKVLRGGLLNPRKSIAFIGHETEAPTLTLADYKNIKDINKYGVTAVMLPFVRGKEDLQNLKSALIEAGAEAVSIFAKIENRTGVMTLEELFPYCDEIVIARGDLGNSCNLWELPRIQEDIANRCKKWGKPFMVVTQMLASMEHSKVPTRAEVTDIFHAARQGAASLMLTGETAAGGYPVEAMEYLVRTAEEAQK
ncbi:MAG: pyruvate kinase [Lachnospiraceae bacterium]